jgi:hypothetical protein
MFFFRPISPMLFFPISEAAHKRCLLLLFSPQNSNISILCMYFYIHCKARYVKKFFKYTFQTYFQTLKVERRKSENFVIIDKKSKPKGITKGKVFNLFAYRHGFTLRKKWNKRQLSVAGESCAPLPLLCRVILPASAMEPDPVPEPDLDPDPT